ncbi:tRNA (adenosine(37)-N6)-threonylcarbamoyltransferase complex ATPase subunit type 1 TsaE [bacterium]|nr:tRNA (adenosine(37)-N6)-threonylcarbamoyltransferase complex ATPase subunit type 1 TsaE [bacterium]
MNTFSVICNSLKDTALLAKNIAPLLENGGFINLFGEIGAGKTALVKLIAEEMDIQEHVTSPSFVILNEYHTGKIPVYHFDLYRLENVGVKTICDELREYSEGKILTFVEWAEFSQDEIPFNRLEINVTYEDNDARKYTINSFGEKENKIIEELRKCY